MADKLEKDLGEGIKVHAIKEDSTSDGGWIWGFLWYDEQYDGEWTRRTPSLTQSQIAAFALWLCLPGHPGSPHHDSDDLNLVE
jgi:hypothetical protein